MIYQLSEINSKDNKFSFSLFDNASEMIFIIDENKNPVYANKLFFEKISIQTLGEVSVNFIPDLLKYRDDENFEIEIIIGESVSMLECSSSFTILRSHLEYSVITVKSKVENNIDKIIPGMDVSNQNFLNALPNGIVIVDHNHNILWLNQKAIEISEDFLGSRFIEKTNYCGYFTIEHKEDIKGRIERCLQGDEVKFKRRLINSENENKWFENTYVPLTNNGQNLYCIISFIDITRFQNSINDLRLNQKIMQAVSDASSELLNLEKIQDTLLQKLSRINILMDISCSAIFKLSDKNTFFLYNDLYVNKHEELILPFTNYLIDEELFLKTLIEEDEIVITQDMQNAFFKNNNHLKKKTILVLPVKVNNRIWGILVLEAGYNKIWSEVEKSNIQTFANFLGFFFKRIEYENEIKYILEETKKADKLKGDFLAQISHEIRTPINSILSFIQLLQSEIRDTLPEELGTTFDFIDRGSKRLVRTIDMMLQMAEIQAECYDITTKRIFINKEYLKKIVANHKFDASDKQIAVNIVQSSGGINLDSDENAVYSIINNIVDNAVKFTTKGFVNLIVKESSIIIEDSGIGMSEEYLSKLFIPFSQEENGYTRTYEGNGLGLAIAKNYADFINAEINVKSKKNIGSTFIINFNIN
ncbi:MAG: PAS domain-containing protein [Melioribacteraceae bacterium]|nr:PAS domain-containing protein [Melioribacteraceae bacterium]